MVKELGTFLEEFVREYLHMVEQCELVEVDYPIKITSEDYRDVEKEEYEKRKKKQAYWSDVDVLGTRGNKIFIISCSEWIGRTKKQVERIVKQLSYAERAITKRFPKKKIIKRVACVAKHKESSFGDINVIYLKDMFHQLRRKMRKRDVTDQHVKFAFEWLIRDLDAVGTFMGRDKAHKKYGFPFKTYITSKRETK